jgi:hypothetical protein
MFIFGCLGWFICPSVARCRDMIYKLSFFKIMSYEIVCPVEKCVLLKKNSCIIFHLTFIQMIKIESQFAIDGTYRVLDEKTTYSIFGIKLLVKTSRNVKKID